MATKIDIIRNPQDLYQGIIEAIKKCKSRVIVVSHAVVGGAWSEQISKELISKAKSGVKVDLHISLSGLIFEDVKKVADNIKLCGHLRRNGVGTHIFPDGFNGRGLHSKLVIVDDTTIFIGGSNIADHYLEWTDTNFKIEGRFDWEAHTSLKKLFGRKSGWPEKLDLGTNISLFYQDPANSRIFERQLVDLISKSKKYLRIVTWYFWPSKRVEEALRQAVKKGVRVDIMYPLYNRMPILNPIRSFYTSKLSKWGINFYIWVKGFNHSKLYWNEKSFIVGSPNLDYFSLRVSEESFIKGDDEKLISELNDVMDTWILHSSKPLSANP